MGGGGAEHPKRYQSRRLPGGSADYPKRYQSRRLPRGGGGGKC